MIQRGSTAAGGKHCAIALVTLLKRNSEVLQPYLKAYQNLSKRERDAPMEGQFPTTFKYQKVREGSYLVQKCPAFDRYKMQVTENSDVYVPERNNKSWDEIFDGLRKERLEQANAELP